jgi:hypothetical protein
MKIYNFNWLNGTLNQEDTLDSPLNVQRYICIWRSRPFDRFLNGQKAPKKYN